MRLLVIRLSSMGDVALTAPVIRAMGKQHPDTEMVLLTREAYSPFFTSIEGVTIFPADLRDRHRGIRGLFRLFWDLRTGGGFDHVIDLHNVLRSKVIRFLFRLAGVPSSVIWKGRQKKRMVISGRKKVKLKHSVERYREVFERGGFPIVFEEGPWIVPSDAALAKTVSLVPGDEGLLVGVAPFAKHRLKMWPADNMAALLNMIAGNHKVRIILFGGSEESTGLAVIQAKVPGTLNFAGKLTLNEELALMSRLDIMIAMDSANMHMAALAGARVVSIWGGTDPLTGFGAWRQPGGYFISIPVDQLTCRPCTVYGKGECRRGDFACMTWLTPEIVYRRLIGQGLL
jgi:ADP-heptose:LPS heptosyltransferase